MSQEPGNKGDYYVSFVFYLHVDKMALKQTMKKESTLSAFVRKKLMTVALANERKKQKLHSPRRQRVKKKKRCRPLAK